MKLDETFRKIGRSAIIITCSTVLATTFLAVRHKIISLERQVEQVTTAHAILRDQADGYLLMISRAGDSLRYKETVILNQRQAIEMGLLTIRDLRDKHMKEVANVIRLREEISIMEQRGRWVDTVYIDTFRDGEWLKIPAKMEFSDQWYKLSVTADHTPVLNDLTVWTEPTITIGTIKPGIFKKPRNVTIYENLNPYVQLKSTESLKVQQQQRWYQATWFKFLAGFTTGVVVNNMVD